jgi:DNA polymerase III delta prime subunit
VRTLSAVLECAGPLSIRRGQAARVLLEDAWSTVDLERPARSGLSERALFDEEGQPVAPGETRAPGYPPNAFLTYWGLKAEDTYSTLATNGARLPELGEDFALRKRLAISWASQLLARQTALILGRAEHVDPQQLAYALATDLRWGEGRLTAGNGRHELYRAALEAFFSTQSPSGAWPRSEPLFHYPQSGNAYCFTYETLTAMLRPALPREGGRVYRELLRENVDKLLLAWHHARDTRVPLDDEGSAYGWSSGHHVFRQAPEAWATASVYSFGQMLRCILGHFAVDAASEQVRIRRPKEADPASARDLLRQRGQTFALDGWTVARQLSSMFMHPRLADNADPSVMDPDTALIDENDARSAILFGPPGTGKTTLVEALAGSLGWMFVEVQAADFLSSGVDAVPARADEIFSALMELDRCVVLFDEIDELIRRREGSETDPFGRFLTTSMLPKIAQLWEQRKILFFVATNHVSKADTAIRRSSRFDAAILVAPPSLAAKRVELKRRMEGVRPPDIATDLVLEAIRPPEAQEHISPADLSLGVLALLRHDQISELADRLTGAPAGRRQKVLREALRVMGEDLLRNEWRPEGRDLPEEPGARLHELYRVLREYQDEERKDRSRRRYAIAETADLVPAGSTMSASRPSGEVLVRVSVDFVSGLPRDEDDQLHSATASGAEAIDDGLLRFRQP